MKTRPLIIFFIISFSFYGCKKNGNEPKKNGNYKFVIDQQKILKNENLPKLIDKLKISQLQTINDVNRIPTQVLNFLNGVDNEFSIANPNDKWNATDVIADKNLPHRKLLYFGNGKNIALLTYNLGGIGMSTKILIFEFDKEKVTDFWCGSVLVDLKNKEQTLKYLQENMNKEWGLNTNILSF